MEISLRNIRKETNVISDSRPLNSSSQARVPPFYNVGVPIFHIEKEKFSHSTKALVKGTLRQVPLLTSEVKGGTNAPKKWV